MSNLQPLRQLALEQISSALQADERFLAAWLAGSFGRGEADEYSDLDLVVVVANEFAATICSTDRLGGAGTTVERLEIISRPGEPVIVHEHHANAPGNGSFTAVVYRSGLAVDWTFVPQTEAVRGADTLLLFEQAAIRQAPPPSFNVDVSSERLAERVAIFWLLAAPAAKAWRRHDGVKFHGLFEMIYQVLGEVEALLDEHEPVYTRQSSAPFCPDHGQQRQALIDVCTRMSGLTGRLVEAGVELPDDPMDVIERWLE